MNGTLSGNTGNQGPYNQPPDTETIISATLPAELNLIQNNSKNLNCSESVLYSYSSGSIVIQNLSLGSYSISGIFYINFNLQAVSNGVLLMPGYFSTANVTSAILYFQNGNSLPISTALNISNFIFDGLLGSFSAAIPTFTSIYVSNVNQPIYLRLELIFTATVSSTIPVGLGRSMNGLYVTLDTTNGETSTFNLQLKKSSF